jgi:hypothetical protein
VVVAAVLAVANRGWPADEASDPGAVTANVHTLAARIAMPETGSFRDRNI